MKVQKSSRITALFLALVMILPLISIPAFAEEAETATPFFEQDFNSVADLNTVVQTNSTTTEIVDGALKISSKIIDTDGKYAKQRYYTINTNANGFVELKADAYTEADGIVTLKEPVTVSTTVKIGSTTTKDVKLKYTVSGPVNTNDYTTEATLTLVEGQKQGDTTLEASHCTPQQKVHICDGNVKIAKVGGDSIAQVHKLVLPNGLSDSVYVLSADYCFGTDFTGASDIKAKTKIGNAAKEFDLINVYNKSDTQVNVGPHSNSGTSVIYPLPTTTLQSATAGAVTVAKGTTFNLKVVIDSSTGIYSVYVNGTLAFIKQDKDITAAGTGLTEWNIGQINRGSTVSKYNAENSYLTIDNIKIYKESEIEKLNLKTYEDVITDYKTNFGGSKINKTEDFESCAVDSNYVGANKYQDADGNYKPVIKNDAVKGNYASIPTSKTIDKNFTVTNAPFISYLATEYAVFAEDVYIPSGLVGGAFYAQFKKIYGSVNGSLYSYSEESWMDLYYLRRNEDATMRLEICGDYKNGNTSYKMNCDTWYTISLVLNLKSGIFDLYVDETYVASSQMYRKPSDARYFTNLTISSDAFIAAKAAKQGTAFEDFRVDNVKYYEGNKPAGVTLVPDGIFMSDNFDNATVGKQADTAKGTTPASAKYATIDGTTAVQMSFAPTATGYKADHYVYNSHVYDLSDSKLAKGTTKKLNDVRNQAGVEFTKDAEGNITVGTTPVTQKATNGDYDIAYGKENINLYWTANSTGNVPTHYYNTVVMEAKYYFEKDSSGKIESQILTNWTGLYEIESHSGQVKFGPAGLKTYTSFNQDEWITVSLVFKMNEHIIDVYANGVYSHSISGVTTVKQSGLRMDEWIVAKVQRQAKIDTYGQTGNFYFDDVKITTYAAGDDITVAGKGLAYVQSKADASVKILNTKTDTARFYCAGGLTPVYFNASDYAGIVATETELGSIRVGADLASSGLRFATKVDTALMDQLKAMLANGEIKALTFGTLVAPAAYMDANGDLDKTNYNVVINNEEEQTGVFVPGKTVLDIQATAYSVWDVDKNAATTHFVGSIIQILEQNYGREFAARGYVEVTLNNGEVIFIGSATTAVNSVKAQAQETIDAGTYVGYADILAILNAYVGQ